MKKRKAPSKLAEIIREGIGPLHTASSRKKRKAHEALDALLLQAEEAERYIAAVGWELSSFYSGPRDDVGGFAEEALARIHSITTKGL